MLFASEQKDPAGLLSEHLKNLPDGDLKNLMNRIAGSLSQYSSGNRILTDDKAPVEVLGMRMIDSLIEEELRYYKAIFASDGLHGLLNALL